MDKMDFWRLHEELTVVQATLLIIGLDPSDYPNLYVSVNNEENPESFNATVTAMARSILSGNLSARINYIHPDLVMLGDVDYDTEI